MELNIYQVDAFAEELFTGNPAAVVPLDKWLDDDLMQKIALENNLSETVFYVPKEGRYHIRWFTPTKEVKLCGHATLAAAFIINKLSISALNEFVFDSLSGELSVVKKGNKFELNFPALKYQEVKLPDWVSGFNISPLKVYNSEMDHLLVFNSQEEIEQLEPNLELLARVNTRGFIVTAKGNEVDFVSRFFAPGSGINEDPVTGSAHTVLTPFWSDQLNKSEMSALQLSQRGGSLQVELTGERVLIAGKAKLFLTGVIHL